MTTIPITEFDPRKPFLVAGQMVRDAFVRLNDLIKRTGGERGEVLGPLPDYTVTTLPNPLGNGNGDTSNRYGLIFVSNEAGGATIAFSDGINWRRVQDRAIVS